MRLWQDVQSDKKKSLLDLAWRHACSPIEEATDPRDRIYALLGIAKDTLGVEPNYSMPTDLFVCKKTQIRAQGANSRRFDVLTVHHDRSWPRIPRLPSWIPNFAVRAGNPITAISPGYPRRYSARGAGPMPALELSFDANPKVLPH